MADPREALLRQMREIRSRLDPEVVERLRLAVLGKVPYDRANARAVVQTFLDGRDDGGAFRHQLEAKLRGEGIDADDALTGQKPPPAIGKRRTGRLF